MVRGTVNSLRLFARLATTVVLLLAFGTSLIFGQGGTATISGVVRDTSGALVPGVTITVKHVDSGLIRTVMTGETGNYSAPALPVGPYEITTTMPGFKQAVRLGINLGVGQEAVIDLTLEVGANAEQVTVSEEAPLVNTTLASTSGLISEQQVKDLPLNGRSFDNLLVLNVSTSNPSSNVNNGAWTAFSVAGERTDRSAWSRLPGPTSCTEASLNICATAHWTPGTSSTKTTRLRSSAISSEHRWVGRSKRTRPSCSETMRAFGNGGRIRPPRLCRMRSRGR